MSFYKVLVRYREPTCELRTGPREYRWTFKLPAASRLEAQQKALAEFKRMARLSSSSWVRRVVSVEAEPAPGPIPTATEVKGKNCYIFRVKRTEDEQPVEVFGNSRDIAMKRVIALCEWIGLSFIQVVLEDGTTFYLDPSSG